MRCPQLEFFFYNECFFCQKVLSEIDTLGIKVAYKNIYENQDNLKRLLSETGRKTTPCLFINGTPMFESQDIIDWLRDNKDSLEKK